MKPFRDETELIAALRELSPEPEEEFAAELDAWAAAGFPRRGSATGLRKRFSSLRERFASTPPRRLLVPAGAFAVVAIALATAVVATTDDTGSTRTNLSGPTLPSTAAEMQEGESAASAGGATGYVERSAADGGASTQSSSSLPSRPTGPYAADAGGRDIERSADVVLGADPADVRGAAAKVFEAVHTADGIVLSSSIRDGDAGEAGADFELLIPSAKLSDALASISRIGEVRSRHEATQDITAPTISVQDKLQDSRATVESLLGELAGADSDEERAAVQAQLRAERFRVASLRSQLSSLERRANLSRVSVRIETGDSSSSGEDEGGSGGWGVGDGIDGAGRILAVAAGVAVIALAILAPFALLVLLAWLSHRAWLRRARRQALSRA